MHWLIRRNHFSIFTYTDAMDARGDYSGIDCAIINKRAIKMASFFRNFGLVVAGYSIGFAFTPEAVRDIQLFLGSIIVLNVLFILLFLQ